ncbi:Enterochelin esterase [Enhygromyxa salina]|uniref:Enterochelin esterase n=1 Tax=Enhygromyxa salina TaxID=215803 RepID=A0A2S9YCX7_9BACT|nr:alpha/beta hydrolase-fold protein [Enhygromyxa salina]PRQ02978.1 Enterochelin esterase [Enhygromyxa salina]
MTTQLRALLASAGEDIREQLDAWVKARSFPLVEGKSATFVWRGEADEVRLRHFIFGLETSQPLERIDGTDLWHLEVEIPPRSRVEYKFEVRRGDHNKWIRDPLNPHLARDPFGANSVLQGAGYEIPDWTRHDPKARPGTLEALTIASEAFGQPRHCKVYLPARFRRTRRYPLLVVHDGSDYLNYAGMKIVLDNLIERLEIPPLIAVFADSPDRLHDYANDERHARFVTEELAPRISSALPILDTPASRCLMGASFGGVAALSTAVRYPNYWGRLLLQSGSFAFTDIGHQHHRGALFDPVVRFMNAFREAPTAVSERVFVSCGVYESLIYENRSLVPLLDETGMQVRFVEARDGHNWENWRDRTREGLSWLFRGPLMMIYE